MKGTCLCGAVSVTAADSRSIGACHCGYCRRWGGGPLLAVHCGPDAVFVGQDQISVYRSSDWAERAFCAKCGAHLYYKLLADGHYFIPAGLLDTTDFQLDSQIYIDKKPPYYDFANQTPTMTEQQVIDAYAPKPSE
ncbi:GFA family protein [Achromobacter aloeverae]|uniref:Aldehyde-activating protein n=2 Tax=Achromobacter aloeverae TaxID=1750518 RepID=A0A4V1MSD6_9BURK|nr:GFA family protein [Achromobacter aloeverae]RXN91209.1 aldehyde-activating protein [Achromobacter aloeverae]